MFRISSIAFVLFLFSGATATIISSDDSYDTAQLKHPHLLSSFKGWMREHKKEYKNDDELLERFAVWVENDAFIHLHNSRIPKPNFTLGHNHFSDMTNQEYHQYNFLGKYARPIPERPSRPITADLVTESRRLLSDVPDSVDWVVEGATTPIKNQGQCGSCWSFSAVAAVESAMYLKTGELVSLSEQQLVDCDDKDNACRGGMMDDAFTYIEGAGGLCTYDSYPYVAVKEDECKVDDCSLVEGSDVINFIDVKHANEESLKAAIAIQPVSVGIEADKLTFQLYKDGVYDDTCGINLDHGVVAVGYGTDEESGEDYWLIRNSWGEGWGKDGYIKIAREAQTHMGKCGIYAVPSRPVTE